MQNTNVIFILIYSIICPNFVLRRWLCMMTVLLVIGAVFVGLAAIGVWGSGNTQVAVYEQRHGRSTQEKQDEIMAPYKKKAKIMGLIACALFIWSIVIIFRTSPSTSDRTVSCKWCGKSYSITSSNGKKITRSNFCKSCAAFYDSYENYKNEQPR